MSGNQRYGFMGLHLQRMCCQQRSPLVHLHASTTAATAFATLRVCAERLQPQEPGSSSDNSPVAPRLIFNSHQSTMANVDSAVKKSVKGADWIDDDEYNKQK